MTPRPPDPQLEDLTDALSNLRDSLVHMSLILKDHLAENSSNARDEVAVEVERYLARIRHVDH